MLYCDVISLENLFSSFKRLFNSQSINVSIFFQFEKLACLKRSCNACRYIQCKDKAENK